MTDINAIREFDFGDMPSTHAEQIRQSVIDFITNTPATEIAEVDRILCVYLVKLDELVALDNLDGLSLSEHFKDLQNTNDSLLNAVTNFISSEVIDIIDNPTRNRKHDQNTLIFDLYFFFEEVFGILVDTDI